MAEANVRKTAKEGRKTLGIRRSRGMAIVVVTAIFAGAMLVLVLFLTRSVIFNAQLIAERDKALENFTEVQTNIDTLRKNVSNMETNENLEFLAGEKGVECYDDKGELIKEYTKISQAQSCSALRTLKDALPLKRNDEGTLAEVNRLISSSGEGITLDKLSMDKETKLKTSIANAKTMAIEMIFSGYPGEVKTAIQTLEKSIRQFEVREMSVTVQDDGKLRVETKLTAYYTSEAMADIREKIMKPGLNGIIWNNLNAKEENK